MLFLIAVLFLAFQAGAQTPDPTLPPANSAVRETVLGAGVQIYGCVAAPAPHWQLTGPEATLTEATSGLKLGTHTAGPTWT